MVGQVAGLQLDVDGAAGVGDQGLQEVAGLARVEAAELARGGVDLDVPDQVGAARQVDRGPGSGLVKGDDGVAEAAPPDLSPRAWARGLAEGDGPVSSSLPPPPPPPDDIGCAPLRRRRRPPRRGQSQGRGRPVGPPLPGLGRPGRRRPGRARQLRPAPGPPLPGGPGRQRPLHRPRPAGGRRPAPTAWKPASRPWPAPSATPARRTPVPGPAAPRGCSDDPAAGRAARLRGREPPLRGQGAGRAGAEVRVVPTVAEAAGAAGLVVPGVGRTGPASAASARPAGRPRWPGGWRAAGPCSASASGCSCCSRPARKARSATAPASSRARSAASRGRGVKIPHIGWDEVAVRPRQPPARRPRRRDPLLLRPLLRPRTGRRRGRRRLRLRRPLRRRGRARQPVRHPVPPREVGRGRPHPAGQLRQRGPCGMTLELLPAVDLLDGQAARLVQGVAGTATGYGDPVEAASSFAAQGANWLHVVDLDAAFGRGPRNRQHLGRIVAAVARSGSRPSGGVRTGADLDALLELGAARVVIGTAALEDPEWVAEACAGHGEAVAVGLDARGRTLQARGWTAERRRPVRGPARLDGGRLPPLRPHRGRPRRHAHRPRHRPPQQVLRRHQPPGDRLRRRRRPRRPPRPGRPRTRAASRAPSSARPSTPAASPSPTPSPPWPSPLEARAAAVTLARRVIPCLDVAAGRVVKGVSVREPGRRRRPGRAGPHLRRRGRRRARVPGHHRHRGGRARPCSRPWPGRPSRCSSRSPSAAGSGPSRTSSGCCGPAPTRCRSTRPPSATPSCCGRGRRLGVQCMVLAIDARRRAPAAAGRWWSTAAAPPPASTPSPGPRGRPARRRRAAASPAWTPTARRPATTSTWSPP